MGEFPDRDDALYMIKDMTYLDATTTYIGSGLRKIRTEVRPPDEKGFAALPIRLWFVAVFQIMIFVVGTWKKKRPR